MSLERFTDPGTARATDRVVDAVVTAIDTWGDPIEVLLPVSGTRVTVAHGLGRIPDGVLVLLSLGGNVRATDYSRWTTTAATLVADANNTRARVIFVTTRKAALHG